MSKQDDCILGKSNLALVVSADRLPPLYMPKDMRAAKLYGEGVSLVTNAIRSLTTGGTPSR